MSRGNLAAIRGHGRGRGSRRGRGFRARQTSSRSRSNHEWKKWIEVRVRINGLPTVADTKNVFDILRREGNITKIDLIEDKDSIRTGEAFVTFSPPPNRAFWDLEDWRVVLDESTVGYPLTFELQTEPRPLMMCTSLDSSTIYPERISLELHQIDFGVMMKPDEMMVMSGATGSNHSRVSLVFNLLRRELVVEFTLVITDSRRLLDNSHKERFKFHVPLHQLDTIWEIDSGSFTALILTLDRPPAYYRNLHNVDLSFNQSKHWNERYRWPRVTEIKQLDHQQDEEPLTLKSSNHVIDIGRWTTYRLTLSESSLENYKLIKSALTDHNVKFFRSSNFKFVARSEPTLWDWIDLPEPSKNARESFLQLMSSEVRPLPWPLRYQLEACISQGCINERNVNKEFIQRLEVEPTALARLEAITDRKTRFFEPMEIFSISLPKKSSRKIPKHCMVQRSANVTPSTIYYNSPTVEMSNRILRQYKEHEDRFLRVRFTDEKFEGRINATEDDTQDSVYTRIYHCLTRGITIGDRHFEYVATGNSQFRENGACFFASTPSLTASMIRHHLGRIGKIQQGEFVEERVVAKYSSRLGQCFSTTHAIRGTRLKIVEIPDIERNGYNFTDGVGKISGFIAQMIATELNIRDTAIPSLFQFRMGGIKGVVAVSPDVKGNEIHIRGSQYKFAAVYEGLEIIRCSSYVTPRLNRQLITILRSLRIPDNIFIEKMQWELKRLEKAMHDESTALAMLQEQIDFNQMTLTLANIMRDGFMRAHDPFAMSILRLWRSWNAKQLKEKAAITVNQGAFLLGCVDETATLRGHVKNSIWIDSLEKRIQALPEIFVQIPDTVKGLYKVVQKVCIVARNPSLHPGDIRVVRAVDNPKLRHLKDVVVFPQTGDRDIPGMCSGGDLDGDDFFVAWDEHLIPPPEYWDEPAMDFTPPQPREVDKVTLDDLVSFYVTYMKTDTLRSIATSHLARADQMTQGARHPICIELAKEHSTAVDYPKSGIPPNPIHKLRPKLYPHFMPNRYRPQDRIYHSETVLGRLYDQVPPADFRPMAHFPFDPRILNAFVLEESVIQAASEVKSDYDAAMRRIMAQHEIETEFEVWTTFVLDHARLTNDYKFHEEIGRASADLKDQYVELCYQRAGGKDFDVIAPFVAAMYMATARDVSEKLEFLKVNNRLADGTIDIKPRDLPFFSFPWLFHRELGRIAGGPKAAAVCDNIAPQQATTKYRPRKGPKLIDVDDNEDDIETEEGIMNRGDVLALPSKENERRDPLPPPHSGHTRMMGQDFKYTNSGPDLDREAAIIGSFQTPLDYDGKIQGQLEDGDIRDENNLHPEIMEGVESAAEVHHSNGEIAAPSCVEQNGRDYGMGTIIDVTAHMPSHAVGAVNGDLMTSKLNSKPHPALCNGIRLQSYRSDYSSEHTIEDFEMKTNGTAEGTEEVMIDIDDELTSMEKLEQVLNS